MTPPNTPPAGGRRPTRPRIQSPTERELVSEQARRERAASMDESSGVVEHDPNADDYEDLTGQHAGEELDRLRRERRTTGQRLTHVERKLDRQVEAFSDFKTEVTGKIEHMAGTVEALTGEIKRTLDAFAAREHVTFTAKVDVDASKQKTEIEAQAETEVARAVAEAKKEAAIELAKVKAEIDAKAEKDKAELVRIENRRKMIQRVLVGAGLIALGIIGHAIAQHFGIVGTP